MMAKSNKIPQLQDVEVEALLPWYAAGTLGPREARSVIVALARDAELAKQYAVIREEYVETARLNESLGAPSPRVLQNLFEAIDAEAGEPSTARSKRKQSSGFAVSLKAYLTALSPQALAWSTATTILTSLLSGSAIGAFMMRYETVVLP